MAKFGTINGRMRVAVVDDDADTRVYFRDILQSDEKFSFAGGFSRAGEAITAIPRLRPDLVLMDISLPDVDCLECTRRLIQIMPCLKVMIVSGNREPSWFDRCLEAGAVAFLLKPLDPAQLLASLRFAPMRVNRSIGTPSGNFQKAVLLTLSPREIDVLGKLAEGLLYKEVSDSLGISHSAVHKTQHRIFKKLKVSNRSEATRLWLENKNR